MKQSSKAVVKTFPRVLDQDEIARRDEEAIRRAHAEIEQFRHAFRKFKRAHKYE